MIVNDIHSRLNETTVHSVVTPASVAEIQEIIAEAARVGRGISIAGGRHAMGGQQFGTDTILIDTTRFDRILDFDRERGLIEVEAGVQWPALIEYLVAEQKGADQQWGIAQKQTGADRLSIGGGLSANVHGRGLAMKPFISDIESFTLIDAEGVSQRCSRSENAELFRLVIGGYGLFGVIATVTVRLVPRRKLRRVVQVRQIEELPAALDEAVADGALYGDLQLAIDPESEDFLQKGIFSTYREVDMDTPVPEDQRVLSMDDWMRLLYLAHTDKSQAFSRYETHYLATSGQIYWSDLHQYAEYLDDYHTHLDAQGYAEYPGTEMITELYVPRERLVDFLSQVREDFRTHNVDLIYSTIRLIERDDESFLAWAKQRYACIIFNLHVEHTDRGRAHAADAFRRLIDTAMGLGGSYFLTYHRHARRDQIETCYPEFQKFLQLKREYDPEYRFRSDWYAHYTKMFGLA